MSAVRSTETPLRAPRRRWCPAALPEERCRAPGASRRCRQRRVHRVRSGHPEVTGSNPSGLIDPRADPAVRGRDLRPGGHVPSARWSNVTRRWHPRTCTWPTTAGGAASASDAATPRPCG